MSETVSLTGGQSATIYGTFTAAGDYVATMFGDTYTAWLALEPDDQKRTLIAATRYLDAQAWNEDADTFAERDAIAAFPQASYELAVLIADDPEVVGAADAGTNIRSVGAGSARVEFFNPQSAQRGTAPVLPPVLMRLVGSYLAANGASASGGYAATGTETPAFGDCAEYRRRWPW